MKKILLAVLLVGLILISLTGCLSTVLPEPNNPPAITSTSIKTVTLGEAYICHSRFLLCHSRAGGNQSLPSSFCIL